jgi:hypothetical protein
MTSTEVNERVRNLTSASSFDAASDPFGTVDKIVDLGSEAAGAIQGIFENPHGTYGTYQLNVLALALEKFANAGNDQAKTLLQRVAAGKIGSVTSLGPQGGADIAIRVASDWVKKSASTTPSPSEEAKRAGTEHEVKEVAAPTSKGNREGETRKRKWWHLWK